MGFLAFGIYVVVAAVVVFLSIKLSTFVDLLDKKTNVSGAFLGAILLAAVTSLPELFTSLTSTLFVRVNQYVIGNILGSNLFNMAMFFIIFTVFFKKVIDAKINRSHIVSLAISGLMYGCVAVAAFLFDTKGWVLGWFNPISIFILALYVFSILKTPKEENSKETEEEEETQTNLTVKQIIILFILCSLLLIGASIGMTYCVDWIVNLYPVIGQTFGGALFLGVATSLPELTATITLCKKGNFNAAIGDVVGSSVFNFFILALADGFSFLVKDSSGSWSGLYRIDSSSLMLIICGLFSNIILLATLFFINKKKISNNKKGKSIVFIVGALTLVSYIVFTVLSNTLTL